MQIAHIKIIGKTKERHFPTRQHKGDAGADVFAQHGYTLEPGRTFAMPLGFGLDLPENVMAQIIDRSSMAKKGLSISLSPIDCGYTGEVHAIITNNSQFNYTISKGDRIGQLVLTPIIIPMLMYDTTDPNIDITGIGEQVELEDKQLERGDGAFGSTGE